MVHDSLSNLIIFTVSFCGAPALKNYAAQHPDKLR
jgi:hypothetical protein